MAIELESEDSSFRASLVELTALLVAEETLEVVLRRVVDLSCRGIGACDYASVTAVRDGEPETIVSSAEVADQIDRAQYEYESGPCLYALRRGEIVSVPSMADDERWTPVRDAAISHGVNSSFSLPMAAGDRHVGALNLYSRLDHGFDSVPPEAALLFASQAAAAVWTARVHEQMRRMITNLEAALDTRDLIGTAKGIVMANERLGGDDAMALMRAVSQHRNVKLRDAPPTSRRPVSPPSPRSSSPGSRWTIPRRVTRSQSDDVVVAHIARLILVPLTLSTDRAPRFSELADSSNETCCTGLD